MRVLVQANRRDLSRRIAFIRTETKSFGEVSFPAYFAGNYAPPADEELDVMICGVLLHKTPCGKHYNFNLPPKCVFIRPIEPEDTYVIFNGFEIVGSGCQTLAAAKTDGGIHLTITPGRLMPYLNVADNSSVGFDDPPEELIPGGGWIRKNPTNGAFRLEGVLSCHELDFVHKVVEKDKAA